MELDTVTDYDNADQNTSVYVYYVSMYTYIYLSLHVYMNEGVYVCT